jgi:hypothetical protein
MKYSRESVFVSRLARLGALGALLMCAACPATLADPGRFNANGTCPDIPTQVFQPDCAGAGCHAAADPQQGLDLESPDVASRLVGVPARGGGLLVDPAHPTASVLYTKLTSTPPFGARMPYVGPPLDDTTIACVLDWISQQQGDAGSSHDGGAPSPAEGGTAELDGSSKAASDGGALAP